MLPLQQNRCHSLSFVMIRCIMYITGAKFEDHCFNISGNILDLVFYYLVGPFMTSSFSTVCIIQKREYL